MDGQTTFRFAEVFSPLGFDNGELIDDVLDHYDISDADYAGAAPLAHDVIAMIMVTGVDLVCEHSKLPPLPLRRVHDGGNPIQYAGNEEERADALEAWSTTQMTYANGDIASLALGIIGVRDGMVGGRDPSAPVH